MRNRFFSFVREILSLFSRHRKYLRKYTFYGWKEINLCRTSAKICRPKMKATKMIWVQLKRAFWYPPRKSYHMTHFSFFLIHTQSQWHYLIFFCSLTLEAAVQFFELIDQDFSMNYPCIYIHIHTFVYHRIFLFSSSKAYDTNIYIIYIWALNKSAFCNPWKINRWTFWIKISCDIDENQE